MQTLMRKQPGDQLWRLVRALRANQELSNQYGPVVVLGYEIRMTEWGQIDSVLLDWRQ